MKISGFGIPPIGYTASGMPACDSPIIKKLAGPDPENGKFGLAMDHFISIGQEEFGKELSIALGNWLKFKSIETLL